MGLLERFGLPVSDTPVVVLNGRHIRRNPDTVYLPRASGLRPAAQHGSVCDLLVGPVRVRPVWSRWSAAATPPARPRCSSPRSPRPSISWFAGRPDDGLVPIPDRSTRTPRPRPHRAERRGRRTIRGKTLAGIDMVDNRIGEHTNIKAPRPVRIHRGQREHPYRRLRQSPFCLRVEVLGLQLFNFGHRWMLTRMATSPVAAAQPEPIGVTWWSGR